jgi:hypothetical protein
MRKRQPQPEPEWFHPYQVIERLHTADLIIRTIPGEEWTLSCAMHKTFLVDIYTLSGRITGTKKVQSWQCGRLSELLLRLLWYGRKVQYVSYQPQAEGNVSTYTRTHGRIAETLEEEAMIRLRGGDLVFCAIPEQRWRLTDSYFGHSLSSIPHVFYLAEEKTIGTDEMHRFKGVNLGHVLLEFICQQTEWIERKPSKIVEFKAR